MATPRHIQELFPSTSRAAAAYNFDREPDEDVKGCICYVNVTVDGGGTVDFKLQFETPQGDFVDIAGAAIAQMGAVGQLHLTVYPGIGETANVSVSDHLPYRWRAVLTIGTAAMTVEVQMEYLK
jgi:hypothetical protein